MDPVVSLDELKKNDGQSGRPAYVALNGKVYDVSDSPMWIDGDHLAEHMAGADLSSEIDGAQHDESVLENVRYVGTLSGK
jgi:predicted heme/steroid binding protein